MKNWQDLASTLKVAPAMMKMTDINSEMTEKLRPNSDTWSKFLCEKISPNPVGVWHLNHSLLHGWIGAGCRLISGMNSQRCFADPVFPQKLVEFRWSEFTNTNANWWTRSTLLSSTTGSKRTRTKTSSHALWWLEGRWSLCAALL